MKMTMKRSLTFILALFSITLVTIFGISCDVAEAPTDEKRWLTVSEQLEILHMSKEEGTYDEIISISDTETTDMTEAIATDFLTEEQTKETVVTQAEVIKSEITYVLNTNSEKFHKPDCSGLPTKNRRDFYGTRDEVVAMGYDPCGRCKP